MKIAYLDLSYGVSGDMVLGALVDLGVSLVALREALEPLAMPSLDLQAQAVQRAGIAATRVHLRVGESPARAAALDQVGKMAKGTEMPREVAQRVERTLRRLADAESRAYGTASSDVRFTNETIAQTVAVLLGFDLLAVEHVLTSEIRVGAGCTSDNNGGGAVPDPVVSQLLVGFWVAGGPVEASLVTPVGAALVRELADGSSWLPSMELTGVGVGAGDLELKGHPHILRILTGRAASGMRDEVLVIEAQIDDMNPEAYDILLEDAFRASALDVTFTPVYMKKNRPGTLVTVLAPIGWDEDLVRLVLRESTTLGVRLRRVERRVLNREPVTVETQWGPVRGKVVWGQGVDRRFKPEYEDCRCIHRKSGVPFTEITRAAQRAYEDQAGGESGANSEGKACPSSGT